MNTAVDLSELATKAAGVAEVASKHEAAINAERDAEALVLQTAIDAAKPALRAVCSRMLRVDKSTSGNNGCNPVEDQQYFEERGLVLVDDFDKGRDTTGNRGWLGGYRIVLLSDGTLAKVEREGSWSCWQGEWTGWEATLTPMTARDVMDREELDECLKAISTALDKQISSKRDEATKAALARAEQLRALATLAGLRIRTKSDG
jgi:hypothetical protein